MEQQAIVSESTLKLIAAFVAHEVKGEAGKARMLDSMIAEGVVPEFFASPGKDSSEERKLVYASLKGAVVAGMPKAVQALICTELAKDASKEQREEKRKAQMKIGPYMARMKSMLKKALESAEEKSPKAPASLEARFIKDLTAWIARLQKAETSALPIPVVIKTLQDLVKVAS